MKSDSIGKLEKVILRQTKEDFFIETVGGDIAVMDLKYSGTIMAKLYGKNIAGMNRDKMIIVFFDKRQAPFMKAQGNFSIKLGIAYGFHGEQVSVTYIKEDDKMQTMRTEWDSSDSKYEDLNFSGYNNKVRKSSISYELNGKEVTVNDKGKRIRSK